MHALDLASKPKYVAYLRVSTDKQGRSGLGLEAQREAVQQFVSSRNGVIIAPEFIEVESGKVNARPQLQQAMTRCRMTGATLLVAKLDRLSRNAAFLLTLRDSGVQFVAADMPDANTLTITVMAGLAQHEREVISQRTKVALQAAKARGVKLGGHKANAPDIRQFKAASVKAQQAIADERVELVADELRKLQQAGLSLHGIARQLNEQGIVAPRGGSWSATTVMRALRRIGG
jgi:DNA invertase Pin-like site-specific DNA recombinase